MDDMILKIVNNLRRNGISISDDEVKKVYEYCCRKIEVAKIKDPEEYFSALYTDEIKNYLLRRAINMSTMLMKSEKGSKEKSKCVVYV